MPKPYRCVSEDGSISEPSEMAGTRDSNGPLRVSCINIIDISCMQGVKWMNEPNCLTSSFPLRPDGGD